MNLQLYIGLIWIALLPGNLIPEDGDKIFDNFDGSHVACGNFQIFILNEDRTGYILVSLEAGQYDLTPHNLFDLSENPELKVEYKRYSDNVSALVCNDVLTGNPPRVVEEITPVSGTVLLELSTESCESHGLGSTYELDVTLKDVNLHSKRVSLKIRNILVGWMPG